LSIQAKSYEYAGDGNEEWFNHDYLNNKMLLDIVTIDLFLKYLTLRKFQKNVQVDFRDGINGLF